MSFIRKRNLILKSVRFMFLSKLHSESFEILLNLNFKALNLCSEDNTIIIPGNCWMSYMCRVLKSSPFSCASGRINFSEVILILFYSFHIRENNLEQEIDDFKANCGAIAR